MAHTTAKASKKNRKHLKNKKFCEKYTNENRRIKNKIKKLKRHLKKLPNDAQAAKALKEIS